MAITNVYITPAIVVPHFWSVIDHRCLHGVYNFERDISFRRPEAVHCFARVHAAVKEFVSHEST